MTSTTASPKRKRSRKKPTPLTEEQRAERRQAELQRIEDAVGELRSSDGWKRWLNSRAAFSRYSLTNTLLIAQQCPHATAVATYKRWKELGRQVRRGETAIVMVTFAGYRERSGDPAAGKPDAKPNSSGTDDDTKFPIFRHQAKWFDVSQTDGEPLPQPPSEPINGDSHGHLLPRLEQHAATLGFSVSYELLTDGSGGFCDYTNQRIVIGRGETVNAQVRTLVHELAHAHGISSAQYGRATAETLVESITYVVCRGAGLDTSGESVPYIAGWDRLELEPLRAYAQLIDETARALEHVIEPPTEPVAS